MGRNKNTILGYLKSRVKDKIEGWDKRFLSKGGKEILLKIVAQAMPNYAINMFSLPIQMCTKIESLMSKFWWQATSNREKGIRCISWERLFRSKSKGGMGFRRLRDFNVSFLGKQGWRRITY